MFKRIFIACAVLLAVESCGDYYWRDYDGIVPYDAIPAGFDQHGRLLYIAQAYMHEFGLLQGTIRPGSMEITVPCYGARKTHDMIKILCAHDHKKYYWLSINSSVYKERTKSKCPVLGGFDQRAAGSLKLPVAPLHTGRTFVDKDVIIGNIAAYASGDVNFYFPSNGTEHVGKNYEVLIYNDLPLALYNKLPQNDDVASVDYRFGSS